MSDFTSECSEALAQLLEEDFEITLRAEEKENDERRVSEEERQDDKDTY